jgi:hypothetical protein
MKDIQKSQEVRTQPLDKIRSEISEVVRSKPIHCRFEGQCGHVIVDVHLRKDEFSKGMITFDASEKYSGETVTILDANKKTVLERTIKSGRAAADIENLGDVDLSGLTIKITPSEIYEFCAEDQLTE